MGVKSQVILIVVLVIVLLVVNVLSIVLFLDSEVSVESGEQIGLIEVESDSLSDVEEEKEESFRQITEEQAIEIALNEKSGEVTDVLLKREFGRITYVIEVEVNGIENYVIIDRETGEVLGIER